MTAVEAAAGFNEREWPQGFVAFEFDPDLSATERQHMRTAMDWWTITTGVKFVYRINDEPAFLFVTRSPDAGISWSRSIGRSGRKQNVEIADRHWNDHGVIAHELCHAIGWKHEQQRPDQEEFVIVEEENIDPPERLDQFAPIDSLLTFGHPYDYESIMHYGACNFSICNPCDADNPDCRTITTKDPDWQDKIGQKDHLSDGDILDVTTVYGPRTARYVRVGGDGDGRLSNPFGSINTALNAIPVGGFILLEGGTYAQADTYSRPSVWRAHGSAVVVK